MKLAPILVCLVLLCCDASYAKSSLTPEQVKDLSVQVCELVPPVEEAALVNYVRKVTVPGWKAESLSAITTADWQDTYQAASETLCTMAEQKGLDSVSLKKCLDLAYAHGEGLAYFPVAAFWCPIEKGHGLWVLAIHWEMPRFEDENGVIHYAKMRHVRSLGYDSKTFQLVGFSTCK